MPENFTPWQIVLIAAALIMGCASAINTIGSAVEKIVKAKRAASAPNEEQNARLDELEKWRKEVERMLASDLQHFKAIDDSNRVTQLALLALLDHGIDGNNIDQMQQAKVELQTYLINR